MCLCMSGVDTPADAARLSGMVQRWVLPSASVVVTNDAVGALAGGTGGRLHGAVLIAGTGALLTDRAGACRGRRGSQAQGCSHHAAWRHLLRSGCCPWTCCKPLAVLVPDKAFLPASSLTAALST